MVVAFKAIIAERCKLAIENASAIDAWKHFDTRSIWKIVCATCYDDAVATHFDAALIDLILFLESIRWLLVA
jgi:ketopantoate hydroxymethyltransferase